MGMDCVDTLYQYRELHRTVGRRCEHSEAKRTAPEVDGHHRFRNTCTPEYTWTYASTESTCVCLDEIICNFKRIKYIRFGIILGQQ